MLTSSTVYGIVVDIEKLSSYFFYIYSCSAPAQQSRYDKFNTFWRGMFLLQLSVDY